MLTRMALKWWSFAGIVKEEGLLRDTVWLRDRLQTAAQRRYHRLYRNCVKRITENGVQRMLCIKRARP